MKGNRFIPDNHQSVTRMLSKEYGQHNKGRNRILLCAVALCIVTLTMVFGITTGKVQAEYTKAARAAGTTASAMIERANASQYQKVLTLGYVKQAGRKISAGWAVAKEAAAGDEGSGQSFELQMLDTAAWEKIVRPAYTDIHGHYPAKKQEIMLPVRVMEALGIKEPGEGMMVTLTVSIGLFREVQEEFLISGWYTDYIESPSDPGTGYISEAKCREWGYDIGKESDILICQADNMGWRETEERLYQDVAEKGADLLVRACNTFAGDAVNRMAGGYGMALLGALVILGGMYFLIHNVMQISMAGDVRQMGLLNTIGATKKQIRGIYFGQIRSVLIPGVLAGTVLSAFVLKILIPEMLGNQYLSSYGGAEGFQIFRPGILAAAVGFTVVLTAGAAAGIIRQVVNNSCVESMNYISADKMHLSGKIHMPDGGCKSCNADESAERQIRRFGRFSAIECSADVEKGERSRRNEPGRSDGRRRIGRIWKKSARGELWYMAWQNLGRNRGQFLRTVFSLFLGMEVFLATIVITKGGDYIHVIEKRPDFLIAGEFSDWGKEEGYGSEYKTRDANEDPMETEGDSFYLLAGNQYDEFSPVSQEVRDELLSLDGVDKNRSYVMEGGYMLTVISRRGLKPLVESSIPGAMDAPQKEGTGAAWEWEYSMIESFDEEVIQIVKEEELDSLKRYAKENNLPVDMDSLTDGTGVMILHDHKLSPKQEKQAEKSVGEPVYFKTMWQRKDSIAWNQADNEERKTMELEDSRKQSDTFTICGYMDNRAEGFPGIRQTWHGAEGDIYYLISEKGFDKLPTERKTLYMELNVDEKLEPQVKARIQDIITRENRRRDMIVTSDEEMGEAGIFCISKSDLRAEAANDIRGSRRILSSVSIVLLLAGLTNFFNVMVTGILARRKEFEVMESIGMTKRQKQELLIAEGMYYCIITGILILTVGSGGLRLVCVYMESKLSYFTSGYPWGWIAGFICGLGGICFLTGRMCCK